MSYNLILNGLKEFYPKTNNIRYNVLKVDNANKINIMIDRMKSFIKNQNKAKHYIGIDLEFNKVSKESKDIALMQINLENDSDTAYIFIFKPSELDTNNKKILIELLTNPNIIKILHGSESLDIPYIFNQLLVSKKNIDGFCSNFYDTKFLCEYYNITNRIKKSCSIYSLLEDHNIITHKKVKELEANEKKMGNISEIIIDIHNMNDSILKYALYDVIYLPMLIRKLLSYGDIYRYLLPDITHLVFKNKRNIEQDFQDLEKLINEQNNHFIKYKEDNFSLNTIYETYLYQYFQFNDMIEINYFRNFFTIITKLVIYSNVNNNYNVLIKNNIKSKSIDYSKYFKWLEQYKYISKLIKEKNKEFVKYI
jgi:hypothetical protein